MNTIKTHITQTLVFLLLIFSTSCDKMMTVKPSTSLATGEHYNSKAEIYAAFIGLSGLFVDVAEQTIILAGLKGDLMMPTSNAPEEFWDIYKFQATNNTTYTSSKKYYDLVLNCNDFLKRVRKYNQDVPGDILDPVYKGMVSSAMNYKVWTWMTIGKFWGEAAIHSKNMEDSSSEGIIRLTLDELPQYLMDYMLGGEYGINAFHVLNWTEIITPGQPDKDLPADWKGVNLDGRVLMGELNLWAGNYQETINWLVGYMDATKKVGNASFRYIFEKGYTSVDNAVVTAVPFNAAYGQKHNLLRFFSPFSPNEYYFSPTKIAVNLFESQVYRDYTMGDRARGMRTSIDQVGTNEYYISKYMLRRDIDDKLFHYISDADLYIYRVSELNLMIAEAYCFMGKFRESLTFLDEGIDDFYQSTGGFLPPFQSLPSNLGANRGIRDRAGLAPLLRDSVFQNCLNLQDSTRALSGYIVDETALEYAYEGKRWTALIRMATNLNEPTFLSKRVNRKFDNGLIFDESMLNDPQKWFIKNEIDNTQKQ